MKFFPKNACWSKTQILEILNDHIDVLNDMAADNGVTTRVSKLKMEDLTDTECQKFVDDEYELMDDISCCEETLFEQREELIRKTIDKAMK